MNDDPKFLEGWRRTRWFPEIEYARLENLHFWPGSGPCVDGYYYWQYKKFAKRIPLKKWLEWGKKKQEPIEKGDRPAMQLELWLH